MAEDVEKLHKEMGGEPYKELLVETDKEIDLIAKANLEAKPLRTQLAVVEKDLGRKQE